MANDMSGEAVSPAETLSALTRHIGHVAMDMMLDTAAERIETGRNGIVVADEERSEWSLAINEQGVTFRFRGWGPYTLPLDSAREVVLSAAARENDD